MELRVCNYPGVPHVTAAIWPCTDLLAWTGERPVYVFVNLRYVSCSSFVQAEIYTFQQANNAGIQETMSNARHQGLFEQSGTLFSVRKRIAMLRHRENVQQWV